MNISTPRPGISGRSVVRAAALLSALPVALVGYSAVAVAAAAPMCAGHHATKVVTSHSAHRVRGTSHRDVILIRDAGHVVLARGGDDLVCGSAGADVVRGGGGNDRILGGRGRDHLQGGPGDDVVRGGGGDDVVRGGGGDDVVTGDAGDVHGDHQEPGDDQGGGGNGSDDPPNHG